MFQGQSMLDALESFLNAPASVVQIAKVRSGIVDGVDQRGHEDMYPTRRCDDPYESDPGRYPGTGIVFGIGG